MACDNIEALRQIMDLDYLVSPRHIRFDLTVAMQAFVKESSLEWKVWHDKGHKTKTNTRS